MAVDRQQAADASAIVSAVFAEIAVDKNDAEVADSGEQSVEVLKHGAAQLVACQKLIGVEG